MTALTRPSNHANSGYSGMILNFPSSPQELELPELAGNHLLGTLDHLGEGPVEGPILHDVQAPPGLHPAAVEAHDPHAGARDELRGVPCEQENSRVGEVPVDEHPPAPEYLLVGGVGPELLPVAVHHLAVDVVDAGPVCQLVLEAPLVLVVLEGANLLAVQPDALVLLPEEDLAVALSRDDPVG